MAGLAVSKLSSKGQVVIPKELRDENHWSEGTELIFINTPQGILMKPKSPFPKTSVDEVMARKKSYNVAWIPEEEWDERMADAIRKEWIK